MGVNRVVRMVKMMMVEKEEMGSVGVLTRVWMGLFRPWLLGRGIVLLRARDGEIGAGARVGERF